jgi:tRNA uridine 5-carboxymethylaminomethyl modification enzyme
MAALSQARALAQSLSVTPSAAARQGLALNQDGQRRTAFELLSYPTIDLGDLTRVWPELSGVAPDVAEQLEIDAKYAVYLERQAADVASFRRDETLELPDGLDYAGIPGLSNEARQRLAAIRPRTIGQAGRIDGITPAALALLAVHLRRPSRAAARHG